MACYTPCSYRRRWPPSQAVLMACFAENLPTVMTCKYFAPVYSYDLQPTAFWPTSKALTTVSSTHNNGLHRCLFLMSNTARMDWSILWQKFWILLKSRTWFESNLVWKETSGKWGAADCPDVNETRQPIDHVANINFVLPESLLDCSRNKQGEIIRWATDWIL